MQPKPEPDPNRLNCYLCGTYDRLGPRSARNIKYCRECVTAANQPPCESMLEQWKVLRARAGLSTEPYKAKHPGPASTETGVRQLQPQAR